MITYSDFQPTAFDPRGRFLEEQQDWLVLPCGRNRDSNALSKSNFRTALLMLGGEGENVEVHLFNHWACGWFEIIIVKPESKAALIAQDIETKLNAYPILNEEDYSNLQYKTASDFWKTLSISERLEYIRKYCKDATSCFAARHDYVPDDDELISALAE